VRLSHRKREPQMEYLWLPICLLIGFFFLWLVFGHREKESQGGDYAARQRSRLTQLNSILYQIGGPECPDGTYSPRQEYLWQEYNRLEKDHNRMLTAERAATIEAAGGYIDDRTQYELDNGINPYK
jgi:hypothetical protein